MRRKRRRLWEGCKTFLILLLAASAVYLASQTLFPGGTGGLSLSLPQQTVPSAQSESFLSQTLRPAAFAVTRTDGRYALLYHQEDTEGYAQLSTLLAEALSDAQSPQSASQQEWQQALSAPGIFCEYLGEMPLTDLSRWLSNQENPALENAAADRLCVTAQRLYFARGEAYWTCPLTSDQTELLESLSALFSPNGAGFAFEDLRFSSLRSDCLTLPVTPAADRLVGDDPLLVDSAGVPDEALDRMLQALSFHPQTNPLYAITGGWAINDGSSTLRIKTDGSVSFHQAEEEDFRYSTEGPGLDLTRTLAEQTVGSVCGAARLYLKEVSEADGVTTVTYGYAYRGAVIQTGDLEFAAQFTLEDGAVTAFLLQPRTYIVSEEPQVTLLPQEQAAAALSPGNSQVLRLLYDDNMDGQIMTPAWAVYLGGRD